MGCEDMPFQLYSTSPSAHRINIGDDYADTQKVDDRSSTISYHFNGRLVTLDAFGCGGTSS